jgi:hypothetical protein
MKKVQQQFTEDYMFENYIAKAVLGIIPKKRPRKKSRPAYHEGGGAVKRLAELFLAQSWRLTP